MARATGAVPRHQKHKKYLRAARGKAVKVISFLIKDLPDENDYRVLFMRRDLDEMLSVSLRMSQATTVVDAEILLLEQGSRKLMAQLAVAS